MRYSVVLTHGGETKIALIKVIREVTGLGLMEAKDIADGTPAVVVSRVSSEEARRLERLLADAGACVELRAE